MAKAQESRGRREVKFFSSPATVHKLVRLFNTEFTNHDYGKPLPLAKTTLGMVSGFIKLGRSNGWEEQYFYQVIKDLVAHWQRLKRMDVRSLKGKKVLLGDRPSLLEFFVARDSILSHLKTIENENKVEEKKTSNREIEVEVKKFGPTEEEMAEEVQRQMEEYL
jgi:hypothetical protein